ncbi:primosome assembly protein PriA, partial [Mycobacterium sp. ITM-2017-0098]
DHVGKLGWLDKVVSAECVLTHDVRRLVDAVTARYAGTRADVLRLAVPPRHASVEKQIPKPVEPLSPTTVNADAWAAYSGGAQFI